MPRVTSTKRSLSHWSSGSRHGRSRKSGLPGRTSIWKRVASLTLSCAPRAARPVVDADLDAGRTRLRESGDAARRRDAPPLPPPIETFPGRPDMAPPATNAHRLPDALRPLERLAYNLLWSWDSEIAAVLAELGPDAAANPVSALVHASPEHLATLAGDGSFRARLASATARLERHLTDPGWYRTLPDAPGAIAYFSPEFGLSESL